MLILEQAGRIYLVDLAASPVTKTLFMTITDIEAGSEHGLINIVIDPDYNTNKWFYVFYTPASKMNRISRFTDTGDPTSRLATENVIWSDKSRMYNIYHMGGGLAF